MPDRSLHIWAKVSRTRSDCCPEPPSTVTSAPSVTASVRARSASKVDLPPNPREAFQMATASRPK